jgi:hypothetical protein
MMACGVISNGQHVPITSFCFVLMIYFIVKGIVSKYVINKLVVLVIWFMQVVTKLTWDAVITSKEGGFVLSKQQICVP